MDYLDYIISVERGQTAVYFNGVLDDTIFHLAVDDFRNYAETDYIQVRIQEANDALEDYLRVHDDWPHRLKAARDIMEN